MFYSDLYLTACCICSRSGSEAEKVVRLVPAGTPSSKRMCFGLVGKYGGSLTSWTDMVTPAVDWSDDWMPLARWAWLDTTTVSMKARFISKSTGCRKGNITEWEEQVQMNLIHLTLYLWPLYRWYDREVISVWNAAINGRLKSVKDVIIIIKRIMMIP